MQNNVTYLSRKLQRSLDNNYNVIDMPAVIEIISTLEKTSVTKELLETTRLGKYINELRRKTSNESLAKRAKELLKKWRDLILPDAAANGTPSGESPTKTKKRPASSTPPDSRNKKSLINGQNREFDFSDNSNCSVKDLKKTDIIFINSDSNSSMPESVEVSTDNNDVSLIPKKRGRKKGSKNHKNLVIAAEESFTNKMAVSRNSKVKTTQELLADIQNRKPSSQDIEARTAQLTESLSRIEHKLNPQKNKNVTPLRASPEKEAAPPPPSDDEIIVDVVGTDPVVEEPTFLTIDSLLMQLPPVDVTVLEETDPSPVCDCPTPKVTEIIPVLAEEEERITVQIVGESLFAPPSPAPPSPPPPVTPPPVTETDCGDERTSDKSDLEENLLCPAKLFLSDKYRLQSVDLDKVSSLRDKFLPNVNGNFAASSAISSSTDDDEENIVPNFMSERLNKPNENFQKYSISINHSDSDVVRTQNPENLSNDDDFREWHETLDVISYNDELLRILPYVIID